VRRLPSKVSALALLLPLLGVPLAACSVVEAPHFAHGSRIDPDQLKELTPGTSTRNDVSTLLGTPTAKATFDDNTWMYIAEQTQARIGAMPAVRSQDVVVLSFDDSGVLRDVKKLNADDGQSISMVARTTPSPGTEATVMQQLLGNIGRFSPTPTGQSPGAGLNGPGL
jgi:outer membrane protein assembly factor BamE (lipoprotein component of BamABCDE complex)